MLSIVLNVDDLEFPKNDFIGDSDDPSSEKFEEESYDFDQ